MSAILDALRRARQHGGRTPAQPSVPTRENGWQKPVFIGVCLLTGSVLAWYATSLLENIPWESVGLGIAVLAVISLLVWLFRSSARRDAAAGWPWGKLIGWAAVGVVALLVLPGLIDWLRTEVRMTTQAIEMKTTIVTPGNPLVVVVEPGWRVDAWPADLSVVKENWSTSKDGFDYILTLTAIREVEVRYRLYLCTAQMPCDSRPPEVTPEPPSLLPPDIRFISEKI